jgi:hypothetical protein
MALPIRTIARSLLGRHGAGYLPSPLDERDALRAFRAPQVLGAAPKILARADELDAHVAILDQVATESCTAHATDYGVQALCGAGRGPGGRRVYTRRSVASPYWHGRALDGLEAADHGAVLRSVLKAYAHLGAPPESTWPLLPRRVNSQPGADVYRLGRAWRGLQYARIEGDVVGGALEALSAGCPVLVGVAVDEAFFEDDGDATIVMMGRTVAHHAMMLSGFSRVVGRPDTVRFRAPNSYGTGWRDGGRCNLGPGVVGLALEAWALTGFRA